MKPLSRRQFGRYVWRGVALCAGGWAMWEMVGCRGRTGTNSNAASGPGPADAATQQSAASPSLRTFSAAELVTVAAVCDRLLPPAPEHQIPGARELGVPSYIDRMLASPNLAGQRDLVLQILPILDRQSRIRTRGRAFHEASSDEQDSLLGAWQHGRGGDARFFQAMLTLTLEGAFGDPRHGGNQGGAGYAMIGFTPGMPVVAGTPHTAVHHGASPDAAPDGLGP